MSGVPQTHGTASNDPSPSTIAREAMKKGEWDKVFALIDKKELDVTQRLGRNKRTMAQIAAYRGDLYALKGLVSRGAQLEGTFDDQGNDVIHSAVRGKKYEVVEWLVSQGVDLDACPPPSRQPQGTPYSPYGGGYQPPRLPPLHLALKSKDRQTAKLLLKSGASPNARDNDGNTALMHVVQTGANRDSRVSINLLMAYGADVNAVNADGKDALMICMGLLAFKGNAPLLLGAGALMKNPAAECTLREFVTKSSYTNRVKAQEYLEELETRPSIDLERAYSKPRLFRKNELGFCALDNPKTWHNIGKIMEHLAAQGDPLTKKELLARDEKGGCLMQNAIDCRVYNVVAAQLMKQGTPMQGRDFAEEKSRYKQMNNLGVHAHDAYLGLTDLCRKDYWKDKGSKALAEFCKDLPPALLHQIPNRYQLQESLIKDEKPIIRGR